MSNNDPQKKTGATPLVEGDLSGGKVKGVVEVKTLLVNYIDGHGLESTKLAVVIPGGEVYFFGREALDLRPAQTWLKASITEHVKE